ncbi:HpcH/HpaI aldolase family protein [Modestobacter sp. VKM Ac-2978]|uniref:HpcH/HpaI aldolase family protein n=1 Tax=Modestobacter sp. VKM Ac-2978 TaxID=3004132 RepID=UPI0022AAC9ED|nr:aldolase/citrate lyase family protein [Modestobacter sp. VKM Ac-2978]MCZ2847807.1 aldolase/citrate lyase family protein [Modestobacter sp. VKM Ac-2978]
MSTQTQRRTGGLFTEEHRTVPLGTWLKAAAAEPVEIMAWAGFDFVVVDLEHAPLGLETAYRLSSSATARGMVPLVRVPEINPSLVQKLLDAGAGGILFPHVDTVEQAAAAGRACRFPPHGTRGSGGTSKAGLWGALPTAAYRTTGNDQVLCIVQLESEQAVHAAAEMLALDQVDAVFVGAADLALSMGLPAGAPAVTALTQHVLDAAQAAGKPCGLAFGSVPDKAAAAARAGAGFLVVANDLSLLAEAARGLVEALDERR